MSVPERGCLPGEVLGKVPGNVLVGALDRLLDKALRMVLHEVLDQLLERVHVDALGRAAAAVAELAESPGAPGVRADLLGSRCWGVGSFVNPGSCCNPVCYSRGRPLRYRVLDAAEAAIFGDTHKVDGVAKRKRGGESN